MRLLSEPEPSQSDHTVENPEEMILTRAREVLNDDERILIFLVRALRIITALKRNR